LRGFELARLAFPRAQVNARRYPKSSPPRAPRAPQFTATKGFGRGFWCGEFPNATRPDQLGFEEPGPRPAQLQRTRNAGIPGCREAVRGGSPDALRRSARRWRRPARVGQGHDTPAVDHHGDGVGSAAAFPCPGLEEHIFSRRSARQMPHRLGCAGATSRPAWGGRAAEPEDRRRSLMSTIVLPATAGGAITLDPHAWSRAAGACRYRQVRSPSRRSKPGEGHNRPQPVMSTPRIGPWRSHLEQRRTAARPLSVLGPNMTSGRPRRWVPTRRPTQLLTQPGAG
jgi:hypothetical protein